MKKIVLTGGGTAGHVTPNIALMPSLKEAGYEIHYIGSHDGIEKRLIEEFDIPYYGISGGKLRRYFDLKNFSDPFRVWKGYHQAMRLMKKIKPDIVFSKGGFVAVPVVLAASRNKVPVIIHESDLTPGLANRICVHSAKKICCNFPETLQYLPKEKSVLTGSPIRKELLAGNRLRALNYCNFTANKPVLLVVGGSSGSWFINNAVREALPELLKTYQAIHLCGKGNLDPGFESVSGYLQMEYAKKEMSDFLTLADIVISRAGANAICELLALRKPNILIPLSTKGSRGDQILNARSFENQGFSIVLEEDELSTLILLQQVDALYQDRNAYVQKMSASEQMNPIEIIMGLIEELAGKNS